MFSYVSSKAASGAFQKTLTLVRVCLVSCMLSCTIPGVHAEASSTKVTGPGWSDENGWNMAEYYSTIQYPDINNDSYPDICVRSGLGIRCVLNDQTGRFSGSTINGPDWSDTKVWYDRDHYSTIQYPDINNDEWVDICARTDLGVECHLNTASVEGKRFSDNAIRVSTFSNQGGWNLREYYSTIKFADINGDQFPDLCARSAKGFFCHVNTGGQFSTSSVKAPGWDSQNGWTDNNDWDKPKYYSTIGFAHINNDGQLDLCARSSRGIECYLSKVYSLSGRKTVVFERGRKRWAHLVETKGGWNETVIHGPETVWSDANGWDKPEYYSTIKYVDLGGTYSPGYTDFCARSYSGIQCHKVTGNPYSKGDGKKYVTTSPGYPQNLSDTSGWTSPDKYSTIRYADINGDGNTDLCGRSAEGMQCYAMWPDKLSGEYFLETDYPGLGWSDSNGWNRPEYYSTIQYVDLDQDGSADVCARSASGIECHLGITINITHSH